MDDGKRGELKDGGQGRDEEKVGKLNKGAMEWSRKSILPPLHAEGRAK